MRKIPFLYNSRSELKIMFALTSINSMPSGFQQYPYKWIALEKLPREALRMVLNEICNRYQLSYPSSMMDHHLFEKIISYDNLSNHNIRHFVKASVEAMDIMRFTGNANFPN
jgi:hypothetical protein